MTKALLLVAAAVSAAPMFAQNGPPPVIAISRESIKEGRSAAHEKVEMDYARAFRKANYPSHYVALEAMSGTSEVWFIMAYPSFEGVEKAEKELTKAPMKGEMEMLDARDGEFRSGMRNLFAVYRPDLSYHPESAKLATTRFMMIASYRVRLGQTDNFLEAAKTILSGYQKANLNRPMLTYQVVSGAPSGLYLFLLPMESLKTLDEEPARQKALREAMGPESFRNLMNGSGQVFVSMESNLFSINPRMSYVSKETEDADPAFWRPRMTVKPAAETKPKEAKTGQ